MKITLKTIGCRLNQAEIESLTTSLKHRGHHITFNDEDADIVVINSCAVTLRSERKTRNLVYRAQRTGSDPMIIVTGCAAPELDQHNRILYLPNDFKYLIPDIIDRDLTPDDIKKAKPDRFNYTPALLARRNRVNLKIQDGCDNLCSYCYIPLVRGASKSRNAGSIMEEFRELVENGYREIILTGVQIGSYQDNGTNLAGLVQKLLETDGDHRIHIPSIAPMYTSERFLELFSHGKMVKHMNLSLQSGSNRILEAMNRSYTREKFLHLVSHVKKEVPCFNLTTDVIVGFPGETEADFRETLEVLEESGCTHVHTFRFSPRPGTVAASMDNQVNEDIKNDRSNRVIQLYNRAKQRYHEQFDGTTGRLLTEQCRNGVTTGHTEYYLPIEVNEKLDRNRFYDITLRYKKDDNKLVGIPSGH